jgi:hypothetical protein
MPIKLGTVGHFGLAVPNPARSGRWWIKTLSLKKKFSFPSGMVVGNDAVDIVLFEGTPRPRTIDHVSFHVRSMRELRAALAGLTRKKVKLENGYRWELSVLAKAAPRTSRKRG